MPRIADKGLEERILGTAQRLWRTRGEKGLTLRSVAFETGTTTTTVYKRFKNKEALLFALAERVRARISEEATSVASVEESLRRFLDFADKHPHEYKLLWGPAWNEIYAPGRPRLVKTWMQEKLALRCGGAPEDYEPTYFALFFMLHGAANFLIATRNAARRSEIRDYCLRVCDTLLANIEMLRTKSPAGHLPVEDS
jgi:AcrR family transcriptional regulator